LSTDGLVKAVNRLNHSAHSITNIGFQYDHRQRFLSVSFCVFSFSRSIISTSNLYNI